MWKEDLVNLELGPAIEGKRDDEKHELTSVCKWMATMNGRDNMKTNMADKDMRDKR